MVQVKVGDSSTWQNARSDDDWETWSFKLDTKKYVNGDQTIYVRAHDGVKYSKLSEVHIITRNPETFPSPDENDEPEDLYQIIQFGFIAVIIFIVIIMLIIIISRKGKKRSD